MPRVGSSRMSTSTLARPATCRARPSAGCRPREGRRLSEARRLDAQVVDLALGERGLGRARPRRPRESSRRGWAARGCARTDRPEHEALRLAVLGDAGRGRARARPRMADGDRAALQRHAAASPRARRRRACAPARCGRPRADRRRRRSRRAAATRLTSRTTVPRVRSLDAQQLVARRAAAPREVLADLAVRHQPHELRDGGRPRGQGGHAAPVAHHGDAVADPRDLLQPVRDVDDRDVPLRAQPLDGGEELLDLGVR